jgi:hypothetical protein
VEAEPVDIAAMARQEALLLLEMLAQEEVVAVVTPIVMEALAEEVLVY